MLDNITALNVDENLVNNKTVKAGVGKYSKPAKLSSGKTFKAKTMEIMSKINTPVNSAPEVAPVESEQPAPVPEVSTPEATSTESVVNTASNQVEETKEPEVTNEQPEIELPAAEEVIARAKKVNISATSLPDDDEKVETPSRKLKVSKTVVTRTGNTLKVLVSVPAVEEEKTTEEVQVAPPVTVATESAPEVPQQVENETSEVNEQPNFFLGQKLNTEAITEDEPKAEFTEEVTENPEVPKEAEVTNEVTQEEKEDKLNQYLGRNQEAVEEDTEILDLNDVLKDLDEYKTASEQIYSGQNEINKLNRDLAEARRILAEKKKEAQQMIVNAKEILESQRNEITSKTQELSDVRDAIIRWTELKEKNQNRVVESDDEVSLGKTA